MPVRFLFSCLLTSATCAATTTQPSAPGPFCRSVPEIHRKADSFKSGHVLAGTSYFYWYDAPSHLHTLNPGGSDALTHHPAEGVPELSFKSVEWHYSQLKDVVAAGIDFVMPVYWGVPGIKDCWSIEGLPPLVQAHDRMLAERQKDSSQPKPPMIGMFYDTSTLWFNRYDGAEIREGPRQDLSSQAGRDWFYFTIRDFFSMIPPEKWARLDGRPIVFLYAGAFASKLDEGLFDDTRARFEKDFGCGIYLVRHADWPGRSDAWYQWGGAVRVALGDVTAGIGPGYDHSAVPNRKPLIVDRRGGKFYQEQWELLLRMGPAQRPWLLHIETWNELHEGTDICRTREFGDQYIQATAKYLKLYRDGKRMESSGRYANAKEIRWTPRESAGLTLMPQDSGDGCWRRTRAGGETAVIPKACAPDQASFFLYFDVDDGFIFSPRELTVEVAVTYLDDGGCAQFRIDYDNADPSQGVRSGAFRPTATVKVGNSGEWRTHRFVLPQVRFVNSSNTADLRIAPEGGPQRLAVREVTMRKVANVK